MFSLKGTFNYNQYFFRLLLSYLAIARFTKGPLVSKFFDIGVGLRLFLKKQIVINQKSFESIQIKGKGTNYEMLRADFMLLLFHFEIVSELSYQILAFIFMITPEYVWMFFPQNYGSFKANAVQNYQLKILKLQTESSKSS